MAVKGSLGITRNDDGSLASLYEWPWYWRYPMAICGAIGFVWGAVALGAFDRTNWGALAVTAAWVLGCLSLAYEAFLLGIFAGLVYGAVAIARWLLPGVFAWGDRHHSTWQEAVVFGLVIYLFFELKALKTRADRLEAQNAKLWEQIREIRYPGTIW